LKHALITAPVLRFPDFFKPFILTTDALAKAIGCVLTEDFDNGEHPISYASRCLNGAKLNYSNFERKELAVVFGIETNRSYLWDNRFIFCTENMAVVYVAWDPTGTPCAQRFHARLLEDDFEVVHKKGTKIPHVDALSRYPPQSLFADEVGTCASPISTEVLHVAYISPQLRSPQFEPLFDLECWETMTSQTPADNVDCGFYKHYGLLYRNSVIDGQTY
jgi:hypothetical protein